MASPILLQSFQWYTPGGGKHWKEMEERAEEFAAMGITHVWLPPAYKGAAGAESVGYDTNDMFDLGEFDQKGGVATKYGDRASFQRACKALSDKGIRVVQDVVFNHKMGADESEHVRVRRVDPEDRTRISEDEFDARAYTRFTFPGRKGKYSEFIWDKQCFSGVDLIEDPHETGIFKLSNEYGEGQWNAEVDEEFGNFDFLLGADVEFRNTAVYEELKFWGRGWRSRFRSAASGWMRPSIFRRGSSATGSATFGRPLTPISLSSPNTGIRTWMCSISISTRSTNS